MKFKFALVDGVRRVPEPGLLGKCPIYGHPMVAKCGKIRTHHWAHLGSPSCDPWWENESEWHRAWKGHFPEEWQEVIHEAEQGEKHIADVKTAREWVIEFQRSPIKPEERDSREVFYKKLIWVVDGTRRKKDWAQFLKALDSGPAVSAFPSMRRILSDECALLREWSSSASRVFFDFGVGGTIWWLLSKGVGKPVYVMPFPSTQFISNHLGQTDQFDELEKLAEGLAVNTERLLAQSRSAPPQGFQGYVGRRNFHRRRF
ncbi:MAG: hypothetical protein ABL962_15820 [Fimbriimonadaceae bacterium]